MATKASFHWDDPLLLNEQLTDEERMVRFIRMNLEHDGFQVSEAFNGKQAIQKLRDTTPDLILLDVMMPKLSGFEVCKKLKEAPDTRRIMVLMVTVALLLLVILPNFRKTREEAFKEV